MLTGIPLLEESPARQSIFSLRGHYWGVGRGGTRDKKFSSCNLIKQKTQYVHISAKVPRKRSEKEWSDNKEIRKNLSTRTACTKYLKDRARMLMWHEQMLSRYRTYNSAPILSFRKEITVQERRFTRVWRFSHVTFVAFKRFPFSDWFAATK